MDPLAVQSSMSSTSSKVSCFHKMWHFGLLCSRVLHFQRRSLFQNLLKFCAGQGVPLKPQAAQLRHLLREREMKKVLELLSLLPRSQMLCPRSRQLLLHCFHQWIFTVRANFIVVLHESEHEQNKVQRCFCSPTVQIVCWVCPFLLKMVETQRNFMKALHCTPSKSWHWSSNIPVQM